MKQFKALKTIKNGNNTTLINLSSVEKVTILAIANVEVGYEQFLSIKTRKEAEAIIEILTKYVQFANGQTELL